MKRINNIRFSILIVALLLIILGGCHKVNNASTPALFSMHLHTWIDTNEVSPGNGAGIYYRDSHGRIERLSVAQLYITNVSLRNSSTQAWYTIPGSIILKRIDNEEYVIGNVPAGSYDDVRFTVGLDDSLNARTPAWYPTAGSPDTVLSTIEQPLMWGSGSQSQGYTFLNVQGYDTTDHVSFSYQLGGVGKAVLVTLPVGSFTMKADQPLVAQAIHVVCDYGKLLEGVNMVTSPSGSFYGTAPQQTVATGIWANIVNIFHYECDTPTDDC